jgi:uncharacterized membrane protein YsdA (DUF1294 family)
MLIKVLLIYYAVFSIVSAIMHVADKRRASRGRRRIPERSLHSMELIGGWPGAICTTRMIRHKTSKPAYMWRLYGIAGIHVLGWFSVFWLSTR